MFDKASSTLEAIYKEMSITGVFERIMS